MIVNFEVLRLIL